MYSPAGTTRNPDKKTKQDGGIYFFHWPKTSKGNGSGERVNEVLSRLPNGVIVKSTVKGNNQRLFSPFNLAPMDSFMYRFADYTAGCRIISDCGIGLTPSAYYPCAVAGGIDRVLGFGMGMMHLPSPGDDMRDQMDIFCRYCGHFGFLWPAKRKNFRRPGKPLM